MSTRELIENYTVYTDALELSHSAAADSTARTTPACIVVSAVISLLPFPTFDHGC